MLVQRENEVGSNVDGRADCEHDARAEFDARRYTSRGTSDISKVSRAGDRIPRDIQAAARKIATCQTAVVRGSLGSLADLGSLRRIPDRPTTYVPQFRQHRAQLGCSTRQFFGR